MKTEIQDIPHSIPLRALVSIYNPKAAQHRCRLYVVDRSWDVDGTPLYDLSFDPNAKFRHDELMDEYFRELEKGSPCLANLVKVQLDWATGSIANGFPERCLTVVPPLEEV